MIVIRKREEKRCSMKTDGGQKSTLKPNANIIDDD